MNWWPPGPRRLFVFQLGVNVFKLAHILQVSLRLLEPICIHQHTHTSTSAQATAHWHPYTIIVKRMEVNLDFTGQHPGYETALEWLTPLALFWLGQNKKNKASLLYVITDHLETSQYSFTFCSLPSILQTFRMLNLHFKHLFGRLVMAKQR